MAKFPIPDAKAPEESKAAPVAAPAEPKAAPAPTMPEPRKAFELWAVEIHNIVFDDRGKASGIRNLRRIPGGTKQAAFVNAARRKGRIPVGKTMTRVEFDAAIEAAKAIAIQ